jgi:hypothetical protein
MHLLLAKRGFVAQRFVLVAVGQFIVARGHFCISSRHS